MQFQIKFSCNRHAVELWYRVIDRLQHMSTSACESLATRFALSLSSTDAFGDGGREIRDIVKITHCEHIKCSNLYCSPTCHWHSLISSITFFLISIIFRDMKVLHLDRRPWLLLCVRFLMSHIEACDIPLCGSLFRKVTSRKITAGCRGGL